MSVVAIQGVRGSYSEEAALDLLGEDAELFECTDFAEVFNAVGSARADYGVVPVENKVNGGIDGVTDLLRLGNFSVLGNLQMKVMHVLAGTRDGEFEGIRTVRSHVEALKQCRRFLAARPHITKVIGADTASSVRRVVEENIADNAAICSRRAAEIYGAKIIAENIADDDDNWTTFCLIGK